MAAIPTLLSSDEDEARQLIGTLSLLDFTARLLLAQRGYTPTGSDLRVVGVSMFWEVHLNDGRNQHAHVRMPISTSYAEDMRHWRTYAEQLAERAAELLRERDELAAKVGDIV